MVTVRQPLQGDRPGLLDLAQRWPAGSYVLLQDEDGFYVLDDNKLDDPNWCVLVAIDDSAGGVVGYLVGQNRASLLPMPIPAGQTAKLEEIGVLTEHQRKGIGTLLVRKFEEWARRKCFTAVYLGGGAAPGFYEKLGYRRVGYCYFVKTL